MRLFVLFLTIPMIEIGLFIQVGGAIGMWPTLAVVILTAFLGARLIRAQGILAIGRLRSSLNELRDPTEPLAHGAMILIAGALLLTPGFLTDAVGFALMVPAVRSALYAFLRSRIKVQNFTVGGPAPVQDGAGTTIDGEYEELDPSGEPYKTPRPNRTRH
jgi:UPF0716 protein FxsA